ncbi:MAG: 37S ribosomal protein S9, mitochondrial [Phylliscum demangeonii]|nr:MAG: 37S ribosomal protein S9, mitochondrial [Phylliscum demangeonii]
MKATWLLEWGRRAPSVASAASTSVASIAQLSRYAHRPRRWQNLRTGSPSYPRSFTTTIIPQATVDSGRGDPSRGESALSIPGTRVVPASPSYFTGTPDFTDDLLNLQLLLYRHIRLPVVAPGQAPRVAWKKLVHYRLQAGESIRAAKYHKILEVVRRLNQIHPAVLPTEVREAMELYKRDIDPHQNRPNPGRIDQFGRSAGAGRRKSSSARVWLVEGEGEVLINGKNLVTAFPRVHDRESVVWALKATDRMDKYNVWAMVRGGGTTGQAEAVTLGVARALLVHEPLLKPALRRVDDQGAPGCVTRDPRRVERKKPGKLKARKMPAWKKR